MTEHRPDLAWPAASAERGGRPALPLRSADLSQALLRVAAHRDKTAFRELFNALAPAVKGFSLRQGADPATAEEIVQDTFLMVWRKAALYAPERGTAAAWIYAIARNVRIDRLRREPAWQELTDEIDAGADEGPPADEAMAAEQIHTRIAAVLYRLPPEQGEVVRLAFYEGLSHAQIAERTGAPLGTVKTRINLAYQKIRAAMQDFL